jgi:hypothetical protein
MSAPRRPGFLAGPVLSTRSAIPHADARDDARSAATGAGRSCVCEAVLDRAWRCGGSQVRMTAIRPMPGGLLSPDLCTRDLFSGLGERVATHAGGRLGAARARRAWQSRHCAATLGVWVPRHPSRRGTLPRYSRNAARPTPGRTARRGRLGARRQTPVRPSPPSPSIRAHSSTRCNSTTHPSRAAPLSRGPARKLRCDPMVDGSSQSRPVSLCAGTTRGPAIGARAHRGAGLARPTIVRSPRPPRLRDFR